MNPDRELQKAYKVLKNDTLPFVGWRNWSRFDIAKFMGNMGFKNGAEIGVSRGLYSRVLLDSIPDLHLICIDPWTGYLNSPRTYVDDDRSEKAYQRTKRRLRGYKNVKYIRMHSLDAAKEIEDESLDFVYIDAMHDFDNVMMDIIVWSKKVRCGGIISGHDYHNAHGYGVTQAVMSYTYMHNIHNWYITRDHPQSFFWVKK